jgi:gluconate 5-dehydrogenase
LIRDGISASSICFDVSDSDAVKKAKEQLDEQGAKVDILVNNAGNQNRKALVDMSHSESGRKLWMYMSMVPFDRSPAFLPGMVCPRLWANCD